MLNRQSYIQNLSRVHTRLHNPVGIWGFPVRKREETHRGNNILHNQLFWIFILAFGI